MTSVCVFATVLLIIILAVFALENCRVLQDEEKARKDAEQLAGNRLALMETKDRIILDQQAKLDAAEADREHWRSEHMKRVEERDSWMEDSARRGDLLDAANKKLAAWEDMTEWYVMDRNDDEWFLCSSGKYHLITYDVTGLTPEQVEAEYGPLRPFGPKPE